MPFDPSAVVTDTVESFREQARAKRLSLSCTIEIDLHTRVIGDPHRLGQVLTNLIGNAIKFTESGSVIVILQEVPDHAGAFKIIVQDTGIGISETAQAALFKEFSQADGSTTRQIWWNRSGISHLQTVGRNDGRGDRSPGSSRKWVQILVYRPVR